MLRLWIEVFTLVALAVLVVLVVVPAIGRRVEQRSARRLLLFEEAWAADDPRYPQVLAVLDHLGQDLPASGRAMDAADRLEDIFRRRRIGRLEVRLSVYRRG